jgi:hypothetical protein
MANEFIVRKGIVVSGASQQSLRTVGNGNILIGSGSTDLGSTLSVIGSSLMSGNTSGSTLLNVVGSQGQLFSVVDTLTGSLMSVNDISGLPILEVFSDDRVVMGEYATNALVVSGRSTGFGVTPSDANYRIISSGSTLFSGGTMIVKGSGTTSSSTAFVVQNSSGGTLLNLFNNGNLNIDNGALYVNGDTGNVLINTTTDSGFKLDVNGTARVNGVLTVGGSVQGKISADNAYLNLYHNGGSLSILSFGFGSTIGASGYLRINQNGGDSAGTTGGVVHRYDFNSTIANSSGTAEWNFQSIRPNYNFTGTYSGTARGIYYNPTLTSLSGTTHRAIETTSGNVIFNGGNVGIGTTNPTTKLHVVGNEYTFNAETTSDINFYTTPGVSRHFNFYNIRQDADFNFKQNVGGAVGTSTLIIKGLSGNVLINTTTDAGYKLDVNGTLRTTSNTYLATTAGLVGIGTTSPSAALHVQSSSGGRTTLVFIRGMNSAAESALQFANSTGNLARIGGINGGGLYFENSTTEVMRLSSTGNLLINTTTDAGYKLQVSGTSLFTGTLTNLSGGSSGQLFSMDLSQSAVTGNTIYAINVSPTLRNTASGQTQVALRVMPTFTGSSTGTSTTNKIVDFGSQNVGTQFTVTDATTGDIYMVNDVSGLPIIAANSSWDVSMYNYPNTVFKKTNNSILLGVQNNTGSTVSIYGDLIINEGFGFTNTTTQVSGTTSTGATSAVTIYTLTTSTNKSYSVSCLTTGYGTSTRNTTSGKVEGTFKNSGGTLSMVGTTIQYVSADIVSTNVDFELSGSSIVLRVTGTTTENYTWGSTITSQVI